MVLNQWLSDAHSQRIRKTNNVGARKLKGLNMIVNISYGYLYLREIELRLNTVYKGNNKITELRTILQRESQNS